MIRSHGWKSTSVTRTVTRAVRTTNAVASRVASLLLPHTTPQPWTKHAQDCYRLIRRIHSGFPVLASEYDDCIAAPKFNGYRSLQHHRSQPLWFSVRDPGSDTRNARGSAAHSLYKNSRRRVVWTALSDRALVPRGCRHALRMRDMTPVETNASR